MFTDAKAPPVSAYGAILVVIFAASTAPIGIRFAQAEGVPSIYIIALRLWIAVILLAPFVRKNFFSVLSAFSPREWKLLVLAGTMHAFGLVFLLFSLQYTTVLINSVIRRITPLLIIILEILVLHAVFSKKVWLGVGLVIAGSALVGLGGISGEAGSSPLLGGILALMDALVNSIYVLIGRSIRNKIPFVMYSWLVFIVAGVISSTLVLAMRVPLTGYPAAGYFWVFIVAIIAQLMGHLPLNAALRFFPATRVSVFTQVSVALSAVLAFVLLKETPSIWQVAGAVCIGLGVIAANGRKTA